MSSPLVLFPELQPSDRIISQTIAEGYVEIVYTSSNGNCRLRTQLLTDEERNAGYAIRSSRTFGSCSQSIISILDNRKNVVRTYILPTPSFLPVTNNTGGTVVNNF